MYIQETGKLTTQHAKYLFCFWKFNPMKQKTIHNSDFFVSQTLIKNYNDLLTAFQAKHPFLNQGKIMLILSLTFVNKNKTSLPLLYRLNDLSEAKLIHILDETLLPLKLPTDFFIQPIFWRIKTEDARKKTIEAERFQRKIESFFKEEYQLDIGLFYDELDQDKGECAVGIELKNDKRYLETKNIAVEYQEKTNANNKHWVNSGILKNDNSEYFLFGDIGPTRTSEHIYSKHGLAYLKVFRKSTLLDIYRDALEKKADNKVFMHSISTSKLMIIKASYVLEFEISVDDMVAEIKKRLK